MGKNQLRRVAVIGGMRTPFVKAGTVFRHIDPMKLSSHAVSGLLKRFDLDPESVDEIVWGRVLHDPFISNLAREIIFDLGLPPTIRALLVSNNCATSLHAVVDVMDSIALGRSDIGIAGGVESMSNPPVLFSREASSIFIEAGIARTMQDRIKAAVKLRPWHFKPVPLSFKEPSTGLTMGQHAEISVKEWKISQVAQDEIAVRSHHRATAATKDGRLPQEIVPVEGVEGDTMIRPETSLEKMATLKPVFDRSGAGTITAGNSSPLTDGAAGVLLMSEEKARENNLEPLACIRAAEFAAIDPNDGLLMAPAVAVPRLLKKAGLTLADMDIVEIHEAFGGQVACNLTAWEKGWKEESIGTVDPAKLNPLGGSIALGHPFAATGARIVTTLAGEMARRNARYGLISICAAGAMAGAMILERS